LANCGTSIGARVPKAHLSAAGVSATSLPSIIQALAANSPTSVVKAACTTILANSNNPAVVKDMAVKMAEIQGLPVAAVNLLPALTAATTPLEVCQCGRGNRDCSRPGRRRAQPRVPSL
jgi:hypothetical protein